MRYLVVAAAAASTGCVGMSYGGNVGISRGKVDRVIVDTMAGLDVRDLTTPSDNDSAFLCFWGIGGRVMVGSNGVGGGPLTAIGASYHRGRYGVVALSSIGGMFDGDQENLIGRFQLGVEIEGGSSDWKIVEHEPVSCGGYIDTGPKPADRRHFVVGLLPGVEYIGSEGGSVSLSLSFREIIEPGTCSGVGP